MPIAVFWGNDNSTLNMLSASVASDIESRFVADDIGYLIDRRIWAKIAQLVVDILPFTVGRVRPHAVAAILTHPPIRDATRAGHFNAYEFCPHG